MAAVNLVGSYNYALVALSVFIAMFASYAALDLASRVTAAGGWTRALWVLGGACAMGTGIWSMHYIGMLAFILPIPMAYHWPTVLLSLLAAILASAIALYVVSRQKMGASQAVAGSVLMGSGIAGMHYIGMAAMRLPAICRFNSSLVVLSVAFAVLISLAALWITFHFRDEKTGAGRKKLAGAVVMGAAIPVMHYTGMAAASFTPSGEPADLSHAVSISALGIAGIVVVTFIVLGLALLTSWMDRRFAAQIFELQQQRSEAYLAEAQRISHTGSFGWKPSTGEMIWSEETFRVFQYDRTSTPTMELVLQRVHPEDVALVKQTIERATQDGKNFENEYRLLMPDGSAKHVHVVSHALGDESGTLEFVGAVMDVTERMRSQEALLRSEAELERQKLRASEERLAESNRLYRELQNREAKVRRLVDANIVGVLMWDLDGRILEANDAFLRMVGYQRDDLLSGRLRWKDLTPPEWLERDEHLWVPQLKTTGTIPPYEKEYFRKDGGRVPILIGAAVFEAGGSEGVSFVLDLGEQKRAQERLEEARQALYTTQAELARVARLTTMGELAASIAHEVNQPLTAVTNNGSACLRLLANRNLDSEVLRRALEEIVADGTRASAVIARIRAFIKKAPAERSELDINHVIQEVLALAGNELQKNRVCVECQLTGRLPRVWADRVQLQQVLLNLIMNGVEAMNGVTVQPRALSLESRIDESGNVLVAVRDSGTGLGSEADRLFTPFFTTKANGMGMGLPISRSLIEGHGGRLWATANSPHGAVFSFTLPAPGESSS